MISQKNKINKIITRKNLLGGLWAWTGVAVRFATKDTATKEGVTLLLCWKISR